MLGAALRIWILVSVVSWGPAVGEGTPTDNGPDREAAALFADGQAKYETHDYAGAIADFTAAYNLALELEDAQIRDEALARLAFNLARAHVSAFDVDADPGHLEIARRLLADYRGHERAQGRDPDADTDVERLELDLRAREQRLADDRDHPEAYALPSSDPALAQRARSRRRAGVAMLAISPAFAGVAVGGAILGARAGDEFETVTTGDARLDARRRGRSGDILLGVGVGLAAASALTGVTLLVLARKAAPERRVALALQPTGVVVRGSF